MKLVVTTTRRASFNLNSSPVPSQGEILANDREGALAILMRSLNCWSNALMTDDKFWPDEVPIK